MLVQNLYIRTGCTGAIDHDHAAVFSNEIAVVENCANGASCFRTQKDVWQLLNSKETSMLPHATSSTSVSLTEFATHDLNNAMHRWGRVCPWKMIYPCGRKTLPSLWISFSCIPSIESSCLFQTNDDADDNADADDVKLGTHIFPAIPISKSRITSI